MEIVPLPALRDNYIWLLLEGKQCVVVDPGDPAPVRAYLQAHGLQLVAILVTHRHNDHIGGIAPLMEDWPVPVYGPPSIAVVSHPMHEGDTLQVTGAQLRVWAVPGHTEEHIAYLGEDFVFCGDTVFSAGCGRILGSASAAEFHASFDAAGWPAGPHPPFLHARIHARQPALCRHGGARQHCAGGLCHALCRAA
ncbi:MAG: MBL fold metallo-hydrolase [Rhodocyclaceae bacterium]